MVEFFTEGILVPIAEELAGELGIAVPGGAMAKLAGTFLSTEALKACLDVLIPAAASGISFSGTGITLALIQQKLREINKKLDLLLDCNKKTAKDKLTEALNSLEHQNFSDAYEEFKKACDKATEAYHTSKDSDSKLTCMRIKLFSQMMMKSYDVEKVVFLPFSKLSNNRKKELASLLRTTLDNLLADLETDLKKFDMVDTVMLKSRAKRKQLEAKLSETLVNVYPFLSEGFEWTQPTEQILENSDIQIIQVFPEYLPVGNESELKLRVGKSSTGEPIHISIFRINSKSKGNKLVVEHVSFPLDDSFEKTIMLEFFSGKMMPFRNDNELFLAAARSGRSQILQSVLDRMPDFDVNSKNFKGDFALGLAARHGHSFLVEKLVGMKTLDPRIENSRGNTALHEAASNGTIKTIKILFTVLSMKDINKTNLDGETPLFLASANGHSTVAELLIDHGAKVDLARTDGSTPLFAAAAKGHQIVVDVLLKFQADKLAKRKSDGATPLLVAASEGHTEVVKTITKKMSKVELQQVRLNEEGPTPGEVAIQKGHTQVHAILKKSGLG